ncbi:hypothetical protein GCM10023215_08900 [Pseudonocardia yuanmonensis]|uniref:Uncharacterized protein n=1 Tax=Pseudonocardia yuanmonensis TaxID=1095914 RepID=A0ABP8W3U0_9PSEU
MTEPFVIDLGDPAGYRDDWGGPSLAGVLAVHCGPGLVAAALLVAALRRRVRRARTAVAAPCRGRRPRSPLRVELHAPPGRGPLDG